MANTKRLESLDEPTRKSPEEIIDDRNRELRQMGTGEEPKKKGETMLEYERRMRKSKDDDE